MFRKKLETGLKGHTIRFRKEPPAIGESMSIWWKSRTKERRMIGVSIITRVDTIVIKPEEKRVIVEGAVLTDREIETLAKSDGFDSVEDFWVYFAEDQGPGFIIYWDVDYITRRRILPWIMKHGGFKAERPRQRREYTPSNGTEGMHFMSHWCENCDRDKDQKCLVLLCELSDEKGSWLKHEGKGYCSAWKPKKIHSLTAKIAASYRQAERKGQTNLFNGVNL